MITSYLKKRRELALAAFSRLSTIETKLARVSQLFVDRLQAGGRILACGNGGSAAEAQHFTTELVGRFRTNRRSLPAISLNADGVALTCIANDFGWDAVFARQVEGLGRPGDVLFCLSTSGSSANILGALKAATAMGIESVALLGGTGGPAVRLATHVILSPGSDTASIQETQLWCVHAICEAIEDAFPMTPVHSEFEVVRSASPQMPAPLSPLTPRLAGEL